MTACGLERKWGSAWLGWEKRGSHGVRMCIAKSAIGWRKGRKGGDCEGDTTSFTPGRKKKFSFHFILLLLPQSFLFWKSDIMKWEVDPKGKNLSSYLIVVALVGAILPVHRWGLNHFNSDPQQFFFLAWSTFLKPNIKKAFSSLFSLSSSSISLPTFWLFCKSFLFSLLC